MNSPLGIHKDAEYYPSCISITSPNSTEYRLPHSCLPAHPVDQPPACLCLPARSWCNRVATTIHHFCTTTPGHHEIPLLSNKLRRPSQRPCTPARSKTSHLRAETRNHHPASCRISTSAQRLYRRGRVEDIVGSDPADDSSLKRAFEDRPLSIVPGGFCQSTPSAPVRP
jgi:hypothetical protein